MGNQTKTTVLERAKHDALLLCRSYAVPVEYLGEYFGDLFIDDITHTRKRYFGYRIYIPFKQVVVNVWDRRDTERNYEYIPATLEKYFSEYTEAKDFLVFAGWRVFEKAFYANSTTPIEDEVLSMAKLAKKLARELYYKRISAK